MKRPSNGFTIIEIIIFLAISGTLLLSATIFLSGRQASARFSQSMRDVNSKVQDLINDVTTGYTGSAIGQGNYCILESPGNPNDRPKINSSGSNADPHCIFLGKAMHFRDEDENIYAYSVFGRRALPNGDLVGSLSDAKPIVAAGITNPSYNSGSANLNENYRLQGGAKVKRIVNPTGPNRSRIAAFFLSFNPTSVKTNGSADLVAYQLPQSSNASPGIPIYNCVSLISCADPPVLSDWQICFESSDGVQTAKLTIQATNGRGITTKMEFVEC